MHVINYARGKYVVYILVNFALEMSEENLRPNHVALLSGSLVRVDV